MQSSKNLCLETAFDCMMRRKKSVIVQNAADAVPTESVSLNYVITVSLTVCYSRTNFRNIMLYRARVCKVVQTTMCRLRKTERNAFQINSLRDAFRCVRISDCSIFRFPLSAIGLMQLARDSATQSQEPSKESALR